MGKRVYGADVPSSSTCFLADAGSYVSAYTHGEYFNTEPFGDPIGKIYGVSATTKMTYSPAAAGDTVIVPFSSQGHHHVILCCLKGTEFTVEYENGSGVFPEHLHDSAIVNATKLATPSHIVADEVICWFIANGSVDGYHINILSGMVFYASVGAESLYHFVRKATVSINDNTTLSSGAINLVGSGDIDVNVDTVFAGGQPKSITAFGLTGGSSASGTVSVSRGTTMPMNLIIERDITTTPLDVLVSYSVYSPETTYGSPVPLHVQARGMDALFNDIVARISIQGEITFSTTFTQLQGTLSRGVTDVTVTVGGAYDFTDLGGGSGSLPVYTGTTTVVYDIDAYIPLSESGGMGTTIQPSDPIDGAQFYVGPFAAEPFRGGAILEHRYSGGAFNWQDFDVTYASIAGDYNRGDVKPANVRPYSVLISAYSAQPSFWQDAVVSASPPFTAATTHPVSDYYYPPDFPNRSAAPDYPDVMPFYILLRTRELYPAFRVADLYDPLSVIDPATAAYINSLTAPHGDPIPWPSNSVKVADRPTYISEPLSSVGWRVSLDNAPDAVATITQTTDNTGTLRSVTVSVDGGSLF